MKTCELRSHAGSKENPSNGKTAKAEEKKYSTKIMKYPVFFNMMSTKRFIELIKLDYETIMSYDKESKDIVWDLITKNMQSVMPGVKESQLKNKWRSIRRKFTNYVEADDKEVVEEPDHLPLLLTFLKYKHIRRFSLNDDISKRNGRRRSTRSLSINTKGEEDDYNTQEQEVLLDEMDIDYMPMYKRQRTDQSLEEIMQDVSNELRVMNKRDEQMKAFIGSTVNSLIEIENAREQREIERERREIARDKLERVREERNSRREGRNTKKEPKQVANGNKEAEEEYFDKFLYDIFGENGQMQKL